MTNRVLCGMHTLQLDNSPLHYPVCVYFTLKNKLAVRETGLASDTSYPTLDNCLDYLADCLDEVREEDEQIAGIEYTEKEIKDSNIKLDSLIVNYPNRELLGKRFEGVICGWHIDLKLNKNSSSPPCLLTNIAWMHNGTMQFVIVNKTNVILPPNLSIKAKEDYLQEQIHKLFCTVSTSYELGGTLRVSVVPSGKKRAKFAV